jgi:hypothetical protein
VVVNGETLLTMTRWIERRRRLDPQTGGFRDNSPAVESGQKVPWMRNVSPPLVLKISATLSTSRKSRQKITYSKLAFRPPTLTWVCQISRSPSNR